MFPSQKSMRLVCELSLNTFLVVALAPTLLLVAPANAQSGQVMDKMQNMPGMASGSTTASTSASGVGVVASIDPAQRKIKLNHEPIPAFNWPAMSMEVAAAPSVDLSKVTTGSKVKFTLTKSSEGTYTLESLSSAQ